MAIILLVIFANLAFTATIILSIILSTNLQISKEYVTIIAIITALIGYLPLSIPIVLFIKYARDKSGILRTNKVHTPKSNDIKTILIVLGIDIAFLSLAC